MTCDVPARRLRGSLPGGEPRAPSVIVCAFTILVLKIALKVAGFAPTIGWLRSHVPAISQAPNRASEIVSAAERAVATAGAVYPGRALCLEQSLALYYLLRRQGLPVKYCQGVQPHPFEAHAWVEYDGHPVNDVREHVRLFARLPDQLP